MSSSLLDSSPIGRYRVVVNANEWKEEKNDEFERALRLVSEEEQTRIRKFAFRKDAKTALIGRLLLNTMVCKTTSLKNSQLSWKRTDKGKPYLDEECFKLVPPERSCPLFSYNISHSGHWVVGASELEFPVGIDVNDHGLRPSCRIDFDADPDTDAEENLPILKKYFSTLSHTLSPPEASYMKSIRFQEGEKQLVEFSRFWTCKESYVKVGGEGFNFDVARLHFDFSSFPQKNIKKLPPTLDAAPIKISLDGADITDQWIFEQFILDRYHISTVAIQKGSSSSTSSTLSSSPSPDSLHPVPLHVLTPAHLIAFLESTH